MAAGIEPPWWLPHANRFLMAVRNARACGWGYLTRGRGPRERVALAELPVAERARVLREFPVQVPHGARFFVTTGAVDASDPDGFAAGADRCVVFRIDELVSPRPVPGAGPAPR